MPGEHNPVVGLWPGLMQGVRRRHRAGQVVTTLHDHARNVRQPVGIGEQLTLSEPARIDEVVVLDAGEGNRELRVGECLDMLSGELQV